MKLTRSRLAIAALTTSLLLFAQSGSAQSAQERKDGFVPMIWDADQGKLFFEITDFNKDILYFTSIAQGSGSGTVGFEWAGTGEGGVIQFQRVGPKVLVVQKNIAFRSGNGGPGMQQGVDESFPDSILASLPVVKTDGKKVLVDAMPLVIRDAVGFAAARARGGSNGPDGPPPTGTWKFDATRSTVYLPRTKAFPKNSEVEVIATYEAVTGGARSAPEAGTLSGRLHYSFVEPPTGYKPRIADARIGVGGVRFSDFSKPYSEANKTEWIRRHRLEKKNPGAALSEPKQPIVYYLDPGVPEPIRTAVKDGFLWWNKSFEAAGFKDAMQIKDMPADMDPMDIRYNQIYWVNRDERGYSTGGGLTDPRTGEILAARVRLESDRIRTASRYWQSYMPTGADDQFWAPLPPYSTPDTEQQLVMLRQALLSAHEVGHSLGFGHNWNSSMNERASVMEYPSPRIKLVNGKIDLSDAYQKEIGAYDTMMIRYAYTEFTPNKEKAGLEGVIQEMRKKGLMFTPSTDPRWNRYDDLGDPADYLRAAIAQRKVLLSDYGPKVLQAGEPYGNLRGIRLWMTYLHHRWAIDSGVRYVGGMYHNFAVKGDSIPATEIVPATKQREILSLLIEALDPTNLTLPEKLLASLTVSTEPGPRRAPGTGPDLENFEMPTGYAFDHLTAARTTAGIILDQLFEPEKAARMISFADRQPNALTLPEVIDAVVKKVWESPVQGGMNKSLQRQTQRVLVDSLMILAANANATPDVKAVVIQKLTALRAKVADMKDADAVNDAHLRQVERDLARFLQNPTVAPRRSSPPPPIMAPI
jgi:hypothetical protein